MNFHLRNFSLLYYYLCLHHEPIPRGWIESSESLTLKTTFNHIVSDGNGRSSDLHPPSISLYVNIKRCKTHGKRSSEKLSVTMVLAAIRRLQQRDCPGFSPDSLLITTHSSCLRRQKVAANQLRVQRYDKKMN